MFQFIQVLSIAGILLGAHLSAAGPIEDAQRQYENREDLDGVNEGISNLEALIAQTQDENEIRKALQLLSRMIYYVGSVSSDKDTIASLHQKGFEYADQALERFFNITPIPESSKDKSGFPWRGANDLYFKKAKEYAKQLIGADIEYLNDLLYLRAINMAAYGQTLTKATTKLRLARFARGLFYLMNLLDEESNTYGASRVLGWVEFNFNQQREAVEYLQSAYENTIVKALEPGKRLSKSASTNFYYASVLLKEQSSAAKELGKKILTDLATLTDDEMHTLDPRAIPETRVQRQKAADKLGEL